MNYLDYERLDKILARDFRSRRPFPWANPEGVLTGEAFRHLMDHLPDLSLFEKRFGYSRDFGQKGHDRYSLEYDKSLEIHPSWHAFVDELHGHRYRQFLRRLYGFRPMKLSFHWHYTPSGCAVSPHCDSRAKIGSHIFYLNTEDDWKSEWGGQTLVLDDHGRLDCKSSPDFEDFQETTIAESIGNRSLIFRRTPNSWHGVKAINCPEGRMRRVFIVVIERVRPIKSIRNYLRGGKPTKQLPASSGAGINSAPHERICSCTLVTDQ
jgi:hypothetical protein